MNIKYYLQKINVHIKQETPRFINIKCPICNEGNSPFKSRGYVLLGSDQPVYNCFNCDNAMSFYNFLSQVNSNIAEEYRQETQKEKLNNIKDINSYSNQIKELFKEEQKKEDNSIFEVKPFTKAIYTINSKESVYPLEPLPEEAEIYLLNRGLTRDEFKDFKFCKESSDIVIPFWYNKNMNEVYGMQMRNLYEKRFHNQMFSNPKVWNAIYCLDLPKGSDVYVFESIIDAISTGFKNCISMIGRSASNEVLDMFKDYNLIFVPDADNAGDAAVYNYAKLGYKCLVHEKDMYNFKDFNKLREMGVQIPEIQEYIKKRTFSALKAQMLVKLIKI